MKYLISLCVSLILLTLVSSCGKPASESRSRVAGLSRLDLSLFNAVDKEAVAKIPILVANGAKINARRRPWNMTPLLYSIQKHVKVTKVLITAGADVNSADRDGVTALMKAVQKGNLQIVNLLLRKGAKTEARDNFDETALAYAVILGRTDILKALITGGANVNMVRYDGNTILVLAREIIASAKQVRFSTLTRHQPEHHNGPQHDHSQKSKTKKHPAKHQSSSIVSSRKTTASSPPTLYRNKSNIIDSGRRNIGLTPHKRYVKYRPQHRQILVSKKQVILEKKVIADILVNAGALVQKFKPRPRKYKMHH
ncbi:hypothetical protein MNBD_GAMMA12-1615 [hydrothermal vent metagenome]|uniref:Uncharacterized protein n=1 Tax=hydrothermal vent metagenome TaxID=652676 RepID=A0A3B0Z8D3_9ZZZZ